jgi:hypothetical protein
MGVLAASRMELWLSKLSELRMEALQFLVFLLRINFDKMQHFCELCEELLRGGI